MPYKLNLDHKKKYSNYLITVNTNMAPVAYNGSSAEERREELVEALRTVLTDLFEHDTVTELVQFLIEGDGWFENVDEADIDFAISEGPVQHRIHAHAIVRIEHNSTINWNYSLFRKMITEGLQFELEDPTMVPHVDIKPFGGRNPTKDAKDYILKDLGGEKDTRPIVYETIE